MPDELKKYAKNVFTNDGQSDVEGFAKKLAKMANEIREAGSITVYYGFHGDTYGNFDRAFDESELTRSLEIAKAFPNAKMVEVSSPTDSRINYKLHNKSGQALFTWCDSDTYIKANNSLPDIVS